MVRLLRAVSLASFVCALPVLSAQGQFEGTVTARLNSAQGGSEITYEVKGDQFRMDFAGRGQSMFILHDASKTSNYMVMPSQRMYVEMPTAMGTDMSDRATGKIPDIKMTGKKETIAGHECEHVLITSDNEQWDACIAHDLGTFPAMGGGNPMAGRGRAEPPPAWQKLGHNAFPLLVQKVGGDKAFEVTKIEKKSLDASLFAIPDGFQKFDMGRFGRPPL
ncbi:MAG: DUF4412 domain-containing protein [Gemmatimonadaceae bacterium]